MTSRLAFIPLLLFGIFGCLAASSGHSLFVIRQGQEQPLSSVAPKSNRSPRLTINPNNDFEIADFDEFQGQTPPKKSISPTPTSETSKTMDPTSTPSASPTPMPSPVDEGEFVIRESTVGYFRLGATGISVTLGASALLKFDITVSAVHASLLASNDAPFKETLVDNELDEYDQLVKDYEGSLNIPFLEFLGANLATNVTREDMEGACLKLKNCDDKTQVARKILNNQPRTTVRLTGEITAIGDTRIPRTYFAFVKVAQVTLSNGTVTIIVSTNPGDIAVATAEGTLLLMGADSFNAHEETES